MAYVPGDRQPQRMVLETPVIRKPHWQMPAALWLLKKLIAGFRGLVSWLVRQYVRFWWATLPATAIGYLYVELGWKPATAIVGVLAGALTSWWWKWRASFLRRLGWFYAAQWRYHTVYRRNWYAICTNLGLAMTFAGDRFFPTIRRVRRDGEGDLITVRMLPGQIPEDWSQHANRFAHAYRVLSCSVRSPQGRKAADHVILHMRVRDFLGTTVAPLPIPETPDLAALPVAVRADSRPVAISLLTHVLVAGATGAGKGSVLWAILSGLASAIRDGLVHVYAFDPKGGVELAQGAGLFHRFFYGDPESMADALEGLVDRMRQRQDLLRGGSRQHRATVDDPAIVILIDEFASLTAYVFDKKTKDRIVRAVSMILSQGRALGVHMVAALQDPRKEILPFRNLFTTRIALRLNEESEADLVLGDDAADRGAACHQIPRTLPGIGYMMLADAEQPVRLRFPYHSDQDVRALAERYGRTLDAVEVPAVPVQMFEVNR